METEIMATGESLGDQKPVFLGMRLTGTIRNGVFAGSVTHSYHNPTQRNIEAIMTMYAPLGSVVSRLSVKFGKSGEKVAKVVKDIEAAERYEDSIDSGDSPVLLEHSGDLRDVFTLNAGNLLPDEKMKARLRFSLELTEEDGRFRLTVPTTEIQKYGDPADLGRKDHQAPWMSHFVENPLEVCIKVAGKDFKGKITSPNRKILQKKSTDEKGAPVIEVSVDGRSFMDGDFIMEIEPEKIDHESFALLDDKKGIYYVMVRHFVGQAKSRQRNAAAKVLIDNSGSMSGGNIVLARDFMQTFTSFLGSSDSCTLSMFGSSVSHISAAPVHADHEGRKLLGAFANMQNANMGGTEMGMAVASVAGLDCGEGRKNILVITDGAIHDEQGVIAAAQDHRCFIVGVGSASHENLERISRATGGKYFAFQAGDNIDLIAKRIYQSIQMEKATDIKVTWPGKPLWSIEPKVIWGNQSVDCFASYKKLPDGEMSISYVQEGQEFHYKLPLPKKANLKGIATLTQGRYIGRLEENGELEKAEELSIQWQLPGRGTSLILEHVRSDSEKSTEQPGQVHPGQMTSEGSFGIPHQAIGDSQQSHEQGTEPELSVEQTMNFAPSRAQVLTDTPGIRQPAISRGVGGSSHPRHSGTDNHIRGSRSVARRLPVVKQSPPTICPDEVLGLPGRYSLFVDDVLVANQALRPKLLAEFLLLQTPELHLHLPRKGRGGTVTNLRLREPDKQLVHFDHDDDEVGNLDWAKFDSDHHLDRHIKFLISELQSLLAEFLGDHPIINKLLLLELNSFESLSERFRMAENLTIDAAVKLLGKEIDAQFRVINKNAFQFMADRLGITGELRLFMRINSRKQNKTYKKELL